MPPHDLVLLNHRAWSLTSEDPAAAKALALRASDEARRHGLATELGRALRTVGACELELGNFHDAHAALAEAVGLLRVAPNASEALAQTCRLLLRSDFLAGRYPSALRHGHEALEAARTAAAADLEARALNDLGSVYAHLGAYEQALQSLLASLLLYERMGTPAPGNPLNNIGNIHMLQEEPERALEFFERARRAFLESGSARDEVIVLGNLGRACEALDRLPEALGHHREALARVRTLDDVTYLAPTLTKLGALLGRLGENAEAHACLREAMEVHARHPNSFEGETLLALVELHLAEGGFPQAIALCERALAQADERGDRGLRQHAWKALSSALAGAGRWREAFEIHRRYHELSRELDRELFSSQTRALLLQHEVERSQREGALLRHRNEALNDAYEELQRLHSELERQASELERLSLEDPLTGLHNRRSLEARLADEIDRTKRYPGTFSLMMCDIDGFKAINDRFSHLVGDEILIRVGAILRASSRKVDVAARTGGEEFVVLFPSTPLGDAVVAADHIRAAVAAYSWGELHPELHVTVSVGVAEAGVAGTKELLAAVDAQLYRAKRSGKNRVCSAPSRVSAHTTP